MKFDGRLTIYLHSGPASLDFRLSNIEYEKFQTRMQTAKDEWLTIANSEAGSEYRLRTANVALIEWKAQR